MKSITDAKGNPHVLAAATAVPAAQAAAAIKRNPKPPGRHIRFEALVTVLLEQDHLSGVTLEEILGPVPAKKEYYAETGAKA